MQSISRSKHQHLVDALLQLENLLGRDFKQDLDKQQSAELRHELEVMHKRYNKQVRELSDLITDYEEMFCKVKMQFLSPKLKELKKQSKQDTRLMPLLVQNIRLVYGT